MGCNAWNHPPNCNCDFRGGHGYGGNPSGSRFNNPDWINEEKRKSWSSKRATYETLTIPNARCPVCGALVFFYQSPFGGRVFFDPPLGPPWPKHPCTDNATSTRQRILSPEKAKLEDRATLSAKFFANGWLPLIDVKLLPMKEGNLLRGKCAQSGEDVRFYTTNDTDEKSPLFYRLSDERMGFVELAGLLRSLSATSKAPMSFVESVRFKLGSDDQAAADMILKSPGANGEHAANRIAISFLNKGSNYEIKITPMRVNLAIKWLKFAARQGNIKALNNLSRIYKRKDYGLVNKRRSLRYSRCAELRRMA